jgi:hypothetical protein
MHPSMKRISLAWLLACTGCVSAQGGSDTGTQEIAIYRAYIVQGEYGTAIEDPACPSSGIRLGIDPSLASSRFVHVLQYGGGRLGAAVKYLIIDGVVRATGKFGSGGEVTLVRVNSMREQLINAPQWVEKFDSTSGCEKDMVHRLRWLQSLQRKHR